MNHDLLCCCKKKCLLLLSICSFQLVVLLKFKSEALGCDMPTSNCRNITESVIFTIAIVD